jgi:beta-lactamase regulating signal transducer with metallopeptidase domain/protocatechuate 3,4-dioxygenase beta subunit/peroxiredoxin
MLAWSGIVAMLGAALFYRHRGFARRLGNAREPDPASLQVDWNALMSQAGIHQSISLVETEQVSAPAVFGLLRPRVLVPPGLTERLPARPLAWVLLHELIHIRRGDLWWKLFQQLVQIAYFFHPAAWIAGRIINVYREYACDDAALAACRETPREECGRGLITVVEQAQRARGTLHPEPGLGLFGSRSFLRSRIVRILDTSRRLSSRLTVRAAVLVAGVALLTLPYVKAQNNPRAAPKRGPKAVNSMTNPDGPHPMELLVINGRTGRPESEVTVRYGQNRVGLDGLKEGKTDGAGKFVIPASATASQVLHLRVDKPGFVSVHLVWNDSERQVPVELPVRFTLSLDPGTIIGGIIQDQDGRPLVGALIKVDLGHPQSQDGVPFVSLSFQTRSDAMGQWQCDQAPENFGQMQLRVSHPDCQAEDRIMTFSPARLIDFKSRTDRTVLRRHASFPVLGHVVDPMGKPIPNASVRWNQSEVLADAKGQFTLKPIALGPSNVWVQAGGFLSHIQDVTVGSGMPAIEIRLEKGRTIKGRVVDHRNKPVKDAYIRFDSGLKQGRDPWATLSGRDGQFLLDVPSGLPGHLEVRGNVADVTLPLKETDRDVSVVLPTYTVMIRGRVLDSETDKPIPSFFLVTRDSIRQRKPGTEGQFELEWPNWQFGDLSLRIASHGYATSKFQTVKTVMPAQEQVDLVFKLKKAPPMTFIVRSPDGLPLKDAEFDIALSHRENRDPQITIEGPHVAANRIPYSPMKTDETGRITFAQSEEPLLLLVAHPSGFAARIGAQLVSPDGSPIDLALEPWGRVDGIVKVASRPAANARVSLRFLKSDRPMSRLPRARNTSTDSQGRFHFENVVPGLVKPSYTLAMETEASSSGHDARAIEVKAGQSARLVLGGAGRTVIGRLILPESMKTGKQANHRKGFLSQSPEPSTGVNKMTPKEGSRQEFDQERDRVTYSFSIESTGSFRVEDVAPGKYELYVQYMIVNQGGVVLDLLGDLKRPVIIPGPDGATVGPDTAHDLGALPFEPIPRVQPGDLMPDDVTRPIDGKELKFSDFRGKFLVICFWESRDSMTPAESQDLRRLYETIRQVKHIAMIGVSFGGLWDTEGRSLATKRGWEWPQTLSDWRSDNRFRFQCGLSKTPSIWLIDPDGKVLSRDLRGDAIKSIGSRLLKAR